MPRRETTPDSDKLPALTTPGPRARAYRVLEVADTAAGRWLNGVLLIVIVLNVVAVILESVDAIYAEYAAWFDFFEAISIAIFTVEYAARVWVSVENREFGTGWRGRLRYAGTPMAIVDLVAILPFFLSAFTDVDTRIFRSLRLLRVFKLSRHSAAMDLLLTVIRNEAATVVSSLFVMLIIIILAASGMYIIEREAQPDAFQSIPQAMWWAAVTLTTVGYGDMVPITALGKIFGLLITVAGVGMVALPAGILASGFSQELLKRRALYRLQVKDSLASGDVSAVELDQLKDSAEGFGLSDEEARILLRTEETNASSRTRCPQCGHEFR